MAAKRILSALVLSCVLPALATASVVFTFNAQNEAWVVVDYPFHSHVATPGMQGLPYDGGFGLPAGSVRIGDVYGETGIAAPAAILGNQSAAYGDTLKYDIYLRFSDQVAYPAVILNAGTYSLYFDRPSPAIGSWTAVAIPLKEAGWKRAGTGEAATPAEFQQALANLSGVYIYTEWNSGPDDTNVDNIRWPGASTGVSPYAFDGLALTGRTQRGAVTLDLTLPAAGQTRLAIHDLAGREVMVLANEWRPAGVQSFRLDQTRLTSGVYFARATLQTPGIPPQSCAAKLPIVR